MTGLLFFIVLLFLTLFILKWILNGSSSKEKNVIGDASSLNNRCSIGDFKSKSFLLSKTEFAFYKELIKNLPPNQSVMVKVGLNDIVSPVNGDRGQWWSDWGRIKSKHLDFVVMDSFNSRILFCIELDDYSHQRESARKRDDVKNYALKSAGIPLKRVKVSHTYSKELIDGLFGCKDISLCSTTV